MLIFCVFFHCIKQYKKKGGKINITPYGEKFN